MEKYNEHVGTPAYEGRPNQKALEEKRDEYIRLAIDSVSENNDFVEQLQDKIKDFKTNYKKYLGNGKEAKLDEADIKEKIMPIIYTAVKEEISKSHGGMKNSKQYTELVAEYPEKRIKDFIQNSSLFIDLFTPNYK